MADLQEQVTAIYNQVLQINSNLEKRALNSSINTTEGILRAEFDSIAANVEIIKDAVRSIQLDIANIITQLRA